MRQTRDDADELSTFSTRSQEGQLKDIESKARWLKDTPILQTVTYRQVFPRHEHLAIKDSQENCACCPINPAIFEEQVLTNYCVTHHPSAVNTFKGLINASCTKIAKGAHSSWLDVSGRGLKSEGYRS